MIRNFYLSAIRNLIKHKSYSFISIIGLAIGITSFTFISLFIINELNYDRFHTNHEQIFRVNSEAIIRGEPNIEATTGAPLAKVMIESYPEVKQATRLIKSSSLLVGIGDRKFNEENVLFAEPSLFEVFDFELKVGNPESALEHSRSIILTESHAKKYFDGQNPMGQVLSVEEDSVFYIVTGIVADAPANSHIQFDMIASLSTKQLATTDRWIGRSLHTYALLNESANSAILSDKMHEIFYKYIAPEITYYTGMPIAEWEGAGNSASFKLIPISDIHLHSEATGELEPTGNMTHIYIYGLIGVIILFMAIFNFVNLATAHSATRAKEVGVRKVIGSTKRALIYQFLIESMMVAFLGTIIAVVAVILFSPLFTSLIGKNLAFNLQSSYLVWLAFGGLTVFVGLLSGFYPSFVLSAFKPSDVLKPSLLHGRKSGWLRNLLVTLQFTASIIIIIGTMAVYEQIEFMFSKNLGFDKDQILVLKRGDWLNDNIGPFKNELLQHANISVVSNSETIPGKTYDIRSYRKKDDSEAFLLLNNQVSYDHQELMGLEMVAGRFFSKEYGADSNAVVVNESAARVLAFEDPIGQPLNSAFKKGRPLKIIGVVRDYNIESLHKSVAPVSLELAPQADDFLSVKMSSALNIHETMEHIEGAWLKHSNNKPFQYFFLDQEYQRLYKSELATGQILLVFSTLSVIVACMGLIGLITFTITSRRKEIGIRKILGAKLGLLIKLLSMETVRLLMLAILTSWPLAYLAIDYWLQNFADRISISPWLYLGATLIISSIVALAISFQTVKAAMCNPVESLRQE